jgi:carbon monoxide dehydrogenase subunit G
MAHVYYSKVLSVPADKVWGMIRDFGALPKWFPFVEKSVLNNGGVLGQVGTIRANTVADGKIIEEQLLELSDRDRRIVYAVISGDVPTKDYSATLTVHEVTADDRSFVEWSASFDVDGEIAPVAEWVRTGIFQTCLEELERLLMQV